MTNLLSVTVNWFCSFPTFFRNTESKKLSNVFLITRFLIKQILFFHEKVLHFSALRIHVSKSTRILLDTLGGYQMIERGEVEMKVVFFH